MRAQIQCATTALQQVGQTPTLQSEDAGCRGDNATVIEVRCQSLHEMPGEHHIMIDEKNEVSIDLACSKITGKCRARRGGAGPDHCDCWARVRQWRLVAVINDNCRQPLQLRIDPQILVRYEICYWL